MSPSCCWRAAPPVSTSLLCDRQLAPRLLALTGAAFGAVLSYRLVALIVRLLPEYAFPHEAAIQVSLPALIFCVVVALVTGILFGLSPALRLSRPDVRDAMQTGSRRIAGKH